MILSNGSATISRLIRKASRALKESFEIRARDWNDALEIYRQSRPLIIKGDYRGGWRHPWNHLLRWNADREEFQVNILAGFVGGTSGGEVEVKVPRELAPESTIERVGEGEEKSVSAYLTDEPEVPVPMHLLRAIGPDGEPTGSSGSPLGETRINYETVPEFFQALGVGEPPEQSLSLSGGFTTTASFEAQEEAEARKLLRAVEVVLTVDRLSLSTQWQASNGADGSFSQFDIIYAAGGVRPNARLSFLKEFKPDVPPSVADLVGNGKGDQPFDRLHIATIYFLSPSGTRAGKPVDETWQPYVKHRVFWNINHTTNRLPTPPESNRLTFPLPLAGGVATQLINSTLTVLNDAYNAALELVNARTVEGRFWTT